MNGECKTLQEGTNSIFLCKPDTLWLLQLLDWDFKVFQTCAQDVSKVLRCSDVSYQKKKRKEKKKLTLSYPCGQVCEKIETVRHT